MRLSLKTAHPGALLAALTLTSFSACQTPQEPAATPVSADGGEIRTAGAGATSFPSLSPGISAPFDVAAVMSQARLAFSRDGESFQAGGDTHAIQVTRDGALRITPLHHEQGDKTAGIGPGTTGLSKLRRGDSVTFRTATIRRGNVQLATGEAAWAGKEGALQRAWTGPDPLLEQLKNRSDGVEQSWKLGRAPSGAGALVVRVRVSGAKLTGASEGGLHFRGKEGPGLRYGHATWIDAAGQRVAIKARATGDGMIELRVPAAVVDGAAYPVVLDPIISAEVQMNKSALGPAWASQSAPAVAYDGTDYLVVWQDYRHFSTGHSDIYGARITTAGKLLDPTGFVVCDRPGNQLTPAIAHDGSTYLVAWADHGSNVNYADIYATRIDSAGVVKDPAGIPIITGGSHQNAPAIGVGGGVFFVVWHDYRTLWDIYGARVSSKGIVLDQGGKVISNAYHHQLHPQVAFDGTNFLVVWHDYRSPSYQNDIYGALVSTKATVVKNSILIGRAKYNQHYPSVAYNANGNIYLVTWQDHRVAPGSQADIYGALVNPSGSITKGNMLINNSTGTQSWPRAVATGSGFSVIWSDLRKGTNNADLYMLSMTAGGVFKTGSEILISGGIGHQETPAVIYDGANLLVVWVDKRNSPSLSPDVYATRVKLPSLVLDPNGLVVSAAPAVQLKPALATNGTDYLVVWQDNRAHNSSGVDIYGVRVSSSGKVKDSLPLVVSNAAGNQQAPAVASDGTNYLVVWQDHRLNKTYADIFGTVVNASTGAISYPNGIQIYIGKNGQSSPAVASDGQAYLVVWQDQQVSLTGSDIFGVIVNNLGGASTKVVPIYSGTGYQMSPDVAYGGGSYLVVWDDSRNQTMSGLDIYAARVASNGTVLDQKGIQVTNAHASQQLPAVSAEGTNFLVAWSDGRDSLYNALNIYGRQVTSKGLVVGASDIPLCTAVGSQDNVDLACSSGSGCLVVWRDERGGVHNYDIMGVQLLAGVVVSSPLGFAISAAAGSELSPVAVTGPAGEVMVAYSAVRAGSRLIMGRSVTPQKKAGLPCNTGAACLSGFCADGVCCDKACGGTNTSDCQACSKASGASADGTCTVLPLASPCRPSAGPCDAAETCDGTLATCPADTLSAAGTVCRASLGNCDAPETCSGSAATCPADKFLPIGTVCRAAVDGCDLAEACDGASAKCPTDTFMPSAKVCRAAAGDCDKAENCTGTSGLCPADQLEPATKVCRAAAGECDKAETCGGVTSCPADVFQSDGLQCTGGYCQQGKCLALDAGTPDLTPDLSKTPDQGVDMSPDKGATPDLVPEPDVISWPDKGAPTTGGDDGCAVAGAGHGGGLPAAAAALLLLMVGIRRRRRRK